MYALQGNAGLQSTDDTTNYAFWCVANTLDGQDDCIDQLEDAAFLATARLVSLSPDRPNEGQSCLRVATPHFGPGANGGRHGVSLKQHGVRGLTSALPGL